jgi:hypothetical protein
LIAMVLAARRTLGASLGGVLSGERRRIASGLDCHLIILIAVEAISLNRCGHHPELMNLIHEQQCSTPAVSCCHAVFSG